MKLMIYGGNKNDSDISEEKIQKEIKEKTEQAIQECQKIKGDIMRSVKEVETKVNLKADK